jgi:hypothetical protein
VLFLLLVSSASLRLLLKASNLSITWHLAQN